MILIERTNLIQAKYLQEQNCNYTNTEYNEIQHDNKTEMQHIHKHTNQKRS